MSAKSSVGLNRPRSFVLVPPKRLLVFLIPFTALPFLRSGSIAGDCCENIDSVSELLRIGGADTGVAKGCEIVEVTTGDTADVDGASKDVDCGGNVCDCVLTRPVCGRPRLYSTISSSNRLRFIDRLELQVTQRETKQFQIKFYAC